ncbi:MAG TPA: EAL domain-containing protein [Allosphingosinicella sp.]
MIHVDEQSLWAARAPDAEAEEQGFCGEALAAAGVGTWRLDMVSGLATWDPVASRLLGIGAGVREEDVLMPVYHEDRDMTATALRASFETGDTYDFEFRILHPSGDVRWMRIIARPRDAAPGARRWLCGLIFDIEERKQAELALQTSRRRLATLVDNLPGFAYRCTTEAPWRLDYASDGALAVTGYSSAEWLSSRIEWATIVHPDDLPGLEASIADAIAERRRFDVTYRTTHKDGSTRWLHERGQAIYGEGREPLSLEGFIGDVTEQKLAERSLTAVLSGTLDCVYSLDREMRFTYMNERARAHYGGRDVVGKFILDVLPGADETDFGACYCRVIRDRRAETIEAYFPPLDSWIEAHVTPTASGITVFYRDISARKRAETALLESTERAHSILDSVPQIVWSCESNGHCDYLSPQWREFTGRDPRGDLGLAWIAAIHEADRDRARFAWTRSLIDSSSFEVEFRLNHRDGGHRWTLARALPERDGEGRVVRWYGTCTDIHDRVIAKRALADSEALNRSILDSSPDCIKLLDRDSRILFVNRLGPKAMDIDDPTHLIGARWLDVLEPANAIEAGRALEKAAAGETAHFTMMQPTAKGIAKWWDVVATPVDADGDNARLAVIARDVTHQKQSEERVRWIANHDPLTGLPNRLLFQERLDEIAAAGAPDSGFALLLLDVDDFKRVNDTLGHDAGDSLLCAFAERLRSAIRADDFVARLGGDEFAVILNGVTSSEEIATAGEAIITELRRPHIHSGRILDFNASIGASLFPIHGTARTELLKHADIALYVAKASWRGNLRIFDAGMRSEMQTRLSMLGIAREALKKDLIVPFYQPKIDLRSGEVAGFEALLRWRHATRGIQTPDSITAAFEDLSTAAAISDRMIDKVIADMRIWLDAGLPFGHVAINAAAAEFRKAEFAESLLERLHRAGIPAERLQLEVTETVFLGRGADYVERALKTLSRAGVQIALDDFGTGYASLSHLKQFPVDVLKIDRSFVSELGVNADAAAIIGAVITLGHSLDIEVVAEGIETPDQAQRLTGKGCHYGQGHLYSPAIPAEQVPEIIRCLSPARAA